MLVSGLGLPYDFCLFSGLFVVFFFLNPGIFLFGTDEVYGILYCLIGHLVKLHVCCLSLLEVKCVLVLVHCSVYGNVMWR